MWSPVSLKQLEKLIAHGESELQGELLAFWNSVKIKPEKWEEKEYGKEGGGFWVVAVAGNEIIYYNDIEEGFNISHFETHGQIKEYWCNQTELNYAVIDFFNMLQSRLRDIS